MKLATCRWCGDEIPGTLVEEDRGNLECEPCWHHRHAIDDAVFALGGIRMPKKLVDYARKTLREALEAHDGQEHSVRVL